ncbi:MAG: N-acetyltransferase [Opitutaceae bacterium]|nr:N-acetyltransferase [Opitutaceae bacterium]
MRDNIETDDSGVRQNKAKNRFELLVDGHLAVADYLIIEDRMIFTHTEVPVALRGGGIAGKLISFAMEAAREEGLKVVPQCSYVDRFLDRHPEYSDLRA